MVDGRITLPMCRGICDFPRTWAQRTFSTVMAVCSLLPSTSVTFVSAYSSYLSIETAPFLSGDDMV